MQCYLIWGSKGFVGSFACSIYGERSNIEQVWVNSKRDLEFLGSSSGESISTPNKFKNLQNIFENSKAEFVINLAARNSIDYCSIHEKEARKVNVKLPHLLAKVSLQSNKKFIHFSSDAVFAQKGDFFTENDIPEPISKYGHMKLESENLVRKANPDSLVIRTRPFGLDPNGRNIFNFFVENLSRGISVEGYVNSFFTPIHVSEMLSQVKELIKMNESGIWHVVGRDRISKYEFGIKIAESLGVSSSLIKPVKYISQNLAAARSFDTSLVSIKSKVYESNCSSLDTGIQLSVNEYLRKVENEGI